MNESAPRLHSRAALWQQVGVNLMVFMATLDMSIVNVSLPTLVTRLNTDFPTIQWVIVSYVLVVACLLLTMSRLGDMYGKKRIFTTGLILFTTGSLLCGLSPSVYWLIGFRGLQGIGAAMSQSLGVALITECVPPQKRGRAIGMIGGTVALGLASGPSVGGLLIDFLGWRSLFLVNVPLGLFSWFVVTRYAPASPPADKGGKFDLPGALVLFVTLGCYSLGMTWGQKHGFATIEVISLLCLAAAGLAAFLTIQKLSKTPMLDLGLFRNPLFSLNLLMGVLVFMSISGQFLIPFFLQMVQGYSAKQMGLLMMIIPLSMGISSPFAGMLSDRFGSRGISILGLLIMVGGCLGISSVQQGDSWARFLLLAMPFGIGTGLFQAPNNSAIMGAAPRERLGVASGLLNYSRVFGQTTGLPLIGTIFTTQVLVLTGLPANADLATAPKGALNTAFSSAYRMLAMILVANVVLAVIAYFIASKRGDDALRHQAPVGRR